MIPVRIIARLDIKGPNVVKGIQFEGLRIMGKPGEMARHYYEEGADEIIFIDTVASLYGRDNILSVVKEAAHDIFVPMTAGGGVRTIDDIKDLLRAGADKVAINTTAVNQPAFIREAANAFGSQCIVLSVHAKRRPEGHWEVYTDNGRERSHRNVLDWVVEAEELGVGEILLTSVDREGTKEGYDGELLREVHSRVQIPVIAAGGAGCNEDIVEVFKTGCADAVSCATIFHYNLCPLPNLKDAVRAAGMEVRL